jgi:hypothetical protein
VVCFLIGAGILIPYSMGYRFDFEKMKITETGGIYVRTFPSADQIIIDSKNPLKPGMFSNWIFVQSLLPKDHTVSIKKEGYYDYFKTILVQERSVTKLENVLLFKNNIKFEVVEDITQSPFNKKTTTPAIKNLITFTEQGNNIVWLGTDGFIYKSDPINLATKPIKITTTPIKISKAGIYKIIADNNHIFVNNNGYLLLLDKITNELVDFYTPIQDAKISSDGKNIIYYGEKYIYLSPLTEISTDKNLIYKSQDKINNVIWLNNDYIIFSTGNSIIISEIDYRGNINAITIPQETTTQIFFDQQKGKLYVSTGDTLLLSEKITQ